MEQQKRQLPLKERLLKGAEILGNLWRKSEERCSAGWSLDPCTCEPKKKFCMARLQWLTLSIEAERELHEGSDGLARSMTSEEWDKTKLSFKMDKDGVGEFKVGTAPECVMSMTDLTKLSSAPQVLDSIIKVMRIFPRSLVIGVEEPVKKPEELQLEAFE